MNNNEFEILDGRTADDIMDDIREKLDELKEKAKTAASNVIGFCIAYPQAAATIAGVAVVGIKSVNKHLDIYRENKLRNSMIYDRSLGMYWETKKPLTANQRLTIESRHNAGESYGAILNDMKILKR